MKIEIQKRDLMSLIVKTQNIAEKKNNMPILVNILLEADNGSLKVYATDLEVSLTNVVPATVTEDGKVVVNARSLVEIVKELEEDIITLNKKENHWLEIKQKRYASKIVGINPDEYPVFPVYSGDKLLTFDASVIKDMIDKTVFSISTDETRYHLNGIYFDHSINEGNLFYKMVATDGHRLSVIEKAFPGQTNIFTGGGVIIPRKGIYEIKKLIDSINGKINLAIDGPQLIVSHESIIMMIRLIEAKYPNYQQLIPKTQKYKIALKKDNFLSSLKRVSLLANQKSKGITFTFSKNKLEMTSNNPELGDATEEIEIDYDGTQLKLAFNARYLTEAVNSIEGDIFDFEFNDQLSAGVVKLHNSSEFTSVIMPMRV